MAAAPCLVHQPWAEDLVQDRVVRILVQGDDVPDLDRLNGVEVMEVGVEPAPVSPRRSAVFCLRTRSASPGKWDVTSRHSRSSARTALDAFFPGRIVKTEPPTVVSPATRSIDSPGITLSDTPSASTKEGACASITVT
jgi:hypothetical protein